MRSVSIALFLLPALAVAQTEADHSNHDDHAMTVDVDGVVMNANVHTLPHGCDRVSTEHAVTIRVGRAYAAGVPGAIFGMSQHEVKVEPCSRVTVTLVNEDDVRHQWMVHGLPKYLYPAGMFHLEATGGHSKTATFIVPGEDKNFLIHCDMAQHMEKGMRGQLVVGKGSGDLWSVTGITDAFYRDDYVSRNATALVAGLLLAGFFATLYINVRRQHE